MMVKNSLKNLVAFAIKLLVVLRGLAAFAATKLLKSSSSYYLKRCASLSLQSSQSVILPFILSSLNLNVSDNDTTLTQLSFGVFLLSLVALLCLINIVGYMIGYYLIHNGKYEEKYPKLSRFITFYKKSTVFFIVIEILLCVICLLILLVFSLLYFYSGINSR